MSIECIGRELMVTRKRRHQWLFRGFYAFYLFVLLGVAYRGFLWWTYSVPPTDLTNRVDACQLHYGELFTRGIVESRRSSGELNILLLGASVAEQTGKILESKLTAAAGIPVHVHNAAVSAHTTQDSLNKLECLMERGAEFDRIIIYHAINDVRMNCVAAEDFRNDYSHCAWYASFNRKKQTGVMSVKETVSDSLDRMIGLGEPDAAHIAFGDDIKTGPAFRLHVEQMLKIAKDAKTPVTLMTFATHFVEGYTKEAFDAKKLGYSAGQYELATELWGKPINVSRGVAIHNEVIRQLSSEHPDLVFVDMESELKDIKYFTDVCHLSAAGLDRFADVVAEQLKAALMANYGGDLRQE
jgi:lysophospholipase L1-like esterase